MHLGIFTIQFVIQKHPTPVVDIPMMFIYLLIYSFRDTLGNIRLNKAVPSVQELISQKHVMYSDCHLARWTAVRTPDKEQLNCCVEMAKALDKGKDLG